MRAVAATNPVHPLTSNEKIALGIGGLLVAIGIGGLALMSSAGAAAPNAGASSAAWTLATKIDPGQTFRASADVVDTLETFFPGATVYVAPTSAIPVDWPAADLAPGEVADGVTTGKGVRFRLDATNAGSTAISLPTPAAFAASMSAAQAAGKLTLAQVQALIAAYSDLRVYVQQPSAHPALVKATWIPLAPGGQIRARSGIPRVDRSARRPDRARTPVVGSIRHAAGGLAHDRQRPEPLANPRRVERSRAHHERLRSAPRSRRQRRHSHLG